MFADKRFKPSSWTTNLLFGDASVMAGGEVRMHPSLGSPGDRVIYVPRNLFPGEKQDCGSEQPSQIVVQVPNADVPNIFAHRQWHAGMILSDLIYSKQLTFHNEIVLELGAGTGLPSISAFRYGEATVVSVQSSARAILIVLGCRNGLRHSALGSTLEGECAAELPFEDIRYSLSSGRRPYMGAGCRRRFGDDPSKYAT